MRSNKEIEEIRCEIQRLFKVKEGAKKVCIGTHNESKKTSEMASDFIKTLNDEIQELMSKLNLLRAQVDVGKTDGKDEEDIDITLNFNVESALTKIERNINFYKEQYEVESKFKDGIKKMLEIYKNNNQSLSDQSSELLLLYHDSIVKVESLRMLMLAEMNKKSHVTDEKIMLNNDTTDDNGYSIPRLIDLTPTRVKSKIEWAKSQMEFALKTDPVESNSTKKKSMRRTLKTKIRLSFGNLLTEETSDLSMDFFKQLMIIHTRWLTLNAQKFSVVAPEDTQLIESLANDSTITGNLTITLHGLVGLDQDIIRDSKASSKELKVPIKTSRVSDTDIQETNIELIVGVDSKHLFRSVQVNPSLTCFGNTSIELELFQNSNIEFIVKSCYTKVMIAFTSLTLIEFIDGKEHRIRIPLEPAGFVYCVVQYCPPRPRVAKITRQKRIFFKNKQFNYEPKSKGLAVLVQKRDSFSKLSSDQIKNKSESEQRRVTTPEASSNLRFSPVKKSKEVQSISKQTADESSDITRAILYGDIQAFKKKKDSLVKSFDLKTINMLMVIGQGNFGRVILAQSRNNASQYFALKTINKFGIDEKDDIEALACEKKILILGTELNCSFLIHMLACFCTKDHLCFLMEFCSAGDLMTHIQALSFTDKQIIFYAACVVLGIEFLHSHGVAYRDLKLDNVMMCKDGYVKLGDFGLCKIGMWYGTRTSTFCGTPEFIAPEMLQNKEYTRSVDWWELGVLIYEMILMECPFPGDSETETFDSIIAIEPNYPSSLSVESKDILTKLLSKEPVYRLGSSERDAEDIKKHPFFKSINFCDLKEKKIQAPFVPSFPYGISSYIDEEFKNLPVVFMEPNKDHPPQAVHKPTPIIENFYKDFDYTYL